MLTQCAYSGTAAVVETGGPPKYLHQLPDVRGEADRQKGSVGGNVNSRAHDQKTKGIKLVKKLKVSNKGNRGNEGSVHACVCLRQRDLGEGCVDFSRQCFRVD